MSETAHSRLDDIGTERGADGPGAQVGDELATRATVDATRALIDALRVADAPSATLARATELIEEATALLDEHRVEALRMQGALRFVPSPPSVRGLTVELDLPGAR